MWEFARHPLSSARLMKKWIDVLQQKLSLHVLLLGLMLGVSLYQHRAIISLDVQGFHVWRQTLTMWNVRNFVRRDPNIFNPRLGKLNGGLDDVVRLEFPMLQWSIAMVQRTVGEDIRYARLILFFVGAGAVVGMFLLLYQLTKNGLSALLGAILFQYSPLFYFYTMNPLPDLLALTGMMVYLYFIIAHRETQRRRDLIWASVALLVATLAKLPFLMVSIVSIYFFVVDLLNKGFKQPKPYLQAAIQLLVIAPALAWYIWVMPSWGDGAVLTGIFKDGLFNENNSRIFDVHMNTFFPHVLLYPPVWALILIGLWVLIRDGKRLGWIYPLIGITILFEILELPTIEIVHDYYLMPFLPWMYVLVGLGVDKLIRLQPWLAIAGLGLCIYSAIYTPPIASYNWTVERGYFNHDLFTHRDQLVAAAPKGSNVIVLNDHTSCIFSYTIDKRAHNFDQDFLPPLWIDDMIRNYGVTYIYSDSEPVNQNPEVLAYVDEEVLVAGSIHVFRLKTPEQLDQEKMGP